jgi:hypothetical protein
MSESFIQAPLVRAAKAWVSRYLRKMRLEIKGFNKLKVAGKKVCRTFFALSFPHPAPF